MIKVTQDLKNTIQRNAHIKEVYFDKFGKHHFRAIVFNHPQEKGHKDNGKIYHQIKDLSGSKTSTNNQGIASTNVVHVYEANPDYELVESLPALEVLQTPVADSPEFADANTAAVFEKQAQEFAKVKAELDELKANPPATDNADILAQIQELKSQMDATSVAATQQAKALQDQLDLVSAEKAKLEEENETLEKMIAESEKPKGNTETAATEDVTKA